MKYTKKDIIRAIKESGVNKSDTLFFSTSLGMIGIPPEYVKSQDNLNKLFWEAILEVVPDGRIIVPTYSYTFGKSTESEPATFDLKSTPAEIGSFPNFVLKQPGVVRSLDPFTSVACYAKDSEEYLDALSNESYGEGSFFERLVNTKNAKCCSIGLGPNWTPFIHYADYLAKVPHRYDKLFWGYIRNGENLIYTPWIYSVRFLGEASLPNAHIAGRAAENVGIWNYTKLGRARIYTASCKEYFDFVMEHLKNDSWYLAEGSNVDVMELEYNRVKYHIINSPFKDSVSGEWLNDSYLLPERWSYSYATLQDSKGYILSTTPWKHSISIDMNVSREMILNHISEFDKNCFFNRDWGFVVKEKLKGKEFKVKIESKFGKGTISKNNGFLYLEEWVNPQEYEGKSLKSIIRRGVNYDWRKDI